MLFDPPTMDTLWGYQLNAASPAIWLAISVLVLLMVDLFLPEDRRKTLTPILALSFVSISFIMTLFNYNPDTPDAFGGMFTADAFTGFLNIVALGTAFISIVLSHDYLERAGMNRGEYYSLLLLSTTGVMFMIGANDLIVIFVALELLSIPLYILTAWRTGDKDPTDLLTAKSEEGGMKYFVLGAFSSAFLVYGFALIYGATGTTSLPGIFAATQEYVLGNTSATVLLLGGTALAFVGLGFKVAAVPFHMWTPDVYEGAPTPITGFMSVAAKIGGFAALVRLLLIGLSEFTLTGEELAVWVFAVQIVAGATLLLGNFVAIAQTNVKRMLAYSSIAHAGYLLIAIAAIGAAGIDGLGGVGTSAAQALSVYMIAYMFTNIGAFAVVQALEDESDQPVTLDSFMGLFNSRPFLAVAMTVFMLSLTGIPLTGGFVGKFLVFGTAVQSQLFTLAIVGVLTSVISAFYYMRVVVNMFLRDSDVEVAVPGATPSLTMAVYASMAGVLITGILIPLVTNLVSMIQFT